jgi:3-hydroxyisobutyrate dehydrogenase-like beta-hydroxyacid dehydrogenase
MSRRSKKNVGVIGLGIIGSRVVENLRRKGFHVFVWNRNPRPVPNFVGSPPEIADMCDHIQLFVSDDDALVEVVKQLAPALAPRHIVLAHPTVSPHSMRSAADFVERRGARFIEAPFTGSKTAAEKGELVYYVSGDEVALREARHILEASSKEVVEIGEIGQATTVKVATNVLTAAIIQAAAEGLALVHNAGLSLEKFTAAVKSNASNSKTLSMKLPKMIERDFEPHFSVKHMLKDIQIASRLGLLHHLDLSMTTAARDRLLEQMQRGYGDDDFCAVVRKYLPEIRSAAEEEKGLELFAKEALAEPAFVPAPAVEQQPAAASPNNETLAPAEGTPTEAPKIMETPAEPKLEAAAGGSEPGQEQSGPQPQTAAAPSEASAPAAMEEPVHEMRSRRSLFHRLLRRGGDQY